MDFFQLPTEIRSLIYSELLIVEAPLDIWVRAGPMRAERWKSSDEDAQTLCTAILRVNKQALDEASPVLYAKNTFRFSGIRWTKTSQHKNATSMGVFSRQIGSNASLIRHVGFTCFCPLPNEVPAVRDRIVEGYGKELEAMRDAYVNLCSFGLSMLLSVEGVMATSSPAAQVLDLLAAHTTGMPSLKNTTVEIRLFGYNQPKRDVSGAPLLQQIRDRGWTVLGLKSI